MKVLIANHQSLSGFAGGAEHYSLWLSERLQNDPAFSAVLLSPAAGAVTSRSKAPAIVRPFGVYWDMAGPGGLGAGKLADFLRVQEKAISELSDFFRQENIEAVFANTIVNLAPILAAARAGIPALWYIHEVFAAHEPPRVFSHLFQRRRYCAFLQKNCRALVFNSQKSKRSFEWMPGCLSADIVYVPIRDALFNDVTSGRPAAAGSEAFVVGFAGMLVAHKGVLDFLEAAHIALRRRPSLRFILCGPWIDEHYKHQVEEFIRDRRLAPSLTLTGPLEDMRTFYRSIDCLVMPSLYQEPFGMVALEAMAYGVPAIVYRHSGVAEIISDGHNGYSVPPAPAAIASRILHLAENPEAASALSSAAKAAARRHGSPDLHYERMKHIILSTRGSGRDG